MLCLNKQPRCFSDLKMKQPKQTEEFKALQEEDPGWDCVKDSTSLSQQNITPDQTMARDRTLTAALLNTFLNCVCFRDK